MRLLPDTHMLLWAVEFSEPSTSRLPPRAVELLSDFGNEVYFSAASIWEVAIKAALRRRDFTAEPARLRQGLLSHGYLELPITGEHGAAVARLPAIHNDPFDRILVAQAIHEGIVLLTVDHVLASYPVEVAKL